MPHYLPDTNVLIDFGRIPAIRAKIENACQRGHLFVLAPPALIELVRGLVASGQQHFRNDKQVFEWMLTQKCEVLPLPRPFMAGILKTTSRRDSGVQTNHYLQLVTMIATAASFEEFIESSKAPGSSWKQIDDADQIHNQVLDREFGGLEKIPKRGGTIHLATQLSRSFGPPGRPPIPLVVERRFSAALEFLQASLIKLGGGAKLRKNDPGIYVDFQLLLYLADPDTIFLTKEDFSNSTRSSPQKDRILSPDSLR